MPATAARTRWLAVPIVALSVVGLAACGSSDSATDPASSSSSVSGNAAPGGGGEPTGMAAFHQCMSEHGVTRPARPAGAAAEPGRRQHDPTKAPPGVDQNTWTTARAACASLAPTPPAAPGG